MSELKLCKFCNTLKPLDEFHSSKGKKQGKHSKCKACKAQYMRDYWQREDVKEREAKRRKTDERYIKRSRERFRDYRKKWERADKERSYATKRERRKKYPKWRLHESVSARMRRDLKRGKCGMSLGEILKDELNYTIKDLHKHLEKKFKPGMTWENYGSEWHIDHIIPVAAFNFENVTDVDFKKCWALKNLQPLWKSENLIKNQRLEKPFQPSLAIGS